MAKSNYQFGLNKFDNAVSADWKSSSSNVCITLVHTVAVHTENWWWECSLFYPRIVAVWCQMLWSFKTFEIVASWWRWWQWRGELANGFLYWSCDYFIMFSDRLTCRGGVCERIWREQTKAIVLTDLWTRSSSWAAATFVCDIHVPRPRTKRCHDDFFKIIIYSLLWKAVNNLTL